MKRMSVQRTMYSCGAFKKPKILAHLEGAPAFPPLSVCRRTDGKCKHYPLSIIEEPASVDGRNFILNRRDGTGRVFNLHR
jgi:hypothetical protein